MLGAPRTDPSVRNLRTGLLPGVFDVEASIGPRVQDADRRQVVGGEAAHAFPGGSILLATSPKRTALESRHMVAKRRQAIGIGWDRVVVEISTDDLTKPLAYLRDG